MLLCRDTGTIRWSAVRELPDQASAKISFITDLDAGFSRQGAVSTKARSIEGNRWRGKTSLEKTNRQSLPVIGLMPRAACAADGADKLLSSFEGDHLSAFGLDQPKRGMI